MRHIIFILSTLLTLQFALVDLAGSTAHAEQAKVMEISMLKRQIKKDSRSSKLRGWDYLASKLIEAGRDIDEVKEIFTSRRMPRFTPIVFKLKPKESKRLYRIFTERKRIKKGQSYLKKYSKSFQEAERLYGVEAEVIAAILLTETNFGEYTGTNPILYRLARLASVKDKANLDLNYGMHLQEDPEVRFEDTEKRGTYLEKIFLPEVIATLDIAKSQNINPFNIKGSSAGAFGLTQFLPSSYLRFAVDGNKNGKKSLFEHEDAIHSIARYFSHFGWKPGLTTEEKKKVIWHYNRSEPYVDTILKVAKLLGQ